MGIKMPSLISWKILSETYIKKNSSNNKIGLNVATLNANDLSLRKTSSENFKLYHNSYSEAVQEAERYLKEKGYNLPSEEWASMVSQERKPAEGDTVRLNIPIVHMREQLLGIVGKNNKNSNIAHIQVYNRGYEYKNPFELNVYTSKSHKKKSSISGLDAYDVLCKNASRDIVISVTASSLHNAFQGAKNISHKYGVNWNKEHIEVLRSDQQWLNDIKIAFENKLKVFNIGEAVDKIIDHKLEGNESSFPKDKGRKFSKLIGQIHSVTGLVNNVSDKEYTQDEVLKEFISSASKRGIDVEVMGNPSEVYIIFNSNNIIQR